MKKIIVFGAGKMGAYIASNLAVEYDVTIADYDQVALDKVTKNNIKKIKADLSDPKIVEQKIKNFELVISALPESFGYNALEAIIKAGKDVVDISFWDQDQSKLSELESIAQEHNVTAFIDCGVAPGFSNALLAFFDDALAGKTKNAVIYVGGIPKERKRGYFAPFSITSLIEEYQRQAAYIHNGNLEKVQALSITKKINFPGVGRLEGAITDGLRTLATNLKHIENMAEFTLRYSGHFSQMKLLSKLGYFNDNAIKVNNDQITAYDLSQILLKGAEDKAKCKKTLIKLGLYDKTTQYNCVNKEISPRKIAIAALSKSLKMTADDRDILVMRVQADDGKIRHTADIYAEHNNADSAMALTTGGMAALAARAILAKEFEAKGIFPLERVIKEKPELFCDFSEGLEKLGVLYSQYISKLT